MKFLKGLALGLLSFLLFMSLSTFGLALTLNNTILNPDFVVTELNNLDISSLAGELISEQIDRGEFPEALGTTLINTIPKLEPIVEEQLGAAIHSVYDYLLGKSQSLDLALMLNNTILSSDFIVSLVNEFDISALAGEFLSEQLTKKIPKEAEEYLAESLDDVLVELEPWAKEQIGTAADPILKYLLGINQSLNVEISLEPLKDKLKESLWQAFLQSPPPELAGIPQTVLEQYFNQFYGEFSKQIPSTLVLDERLVGTETPAKITEALAEAEKGLEQGRQYVGYFQLAYKALIGFMLLLILGIILISRQVRDITRRLGTPCLTYGAVWYAGIFVTKYFAGEQLAQVPIPSQLQAWIPQLTSNLLAPLEMLSLGLLISGVILLIASFVYKPRQPSS